MMPAGSAPSAIDFSVPLGRLNLLIVPYLLPAVAMIAAFRWLHGRDALVAGFDWFAEPLMLIAALVAGVVVHEGLHGAVWAWAGRLQRREVSFGFSWKAMMPYAHARVPLTAPAYLAGALAPFALLGVLPFVAAMVSGNGALLVAAAAMTASAAGDLWIAGRLRRVPDGWRVQDHPTQGGFFAMPPATGVPAG